MAHPEVECAGDVFQIRRVAENTVYYISIRADSRQGAILLLRVLARS
jgi:hypothetical protein